jgi:hypothetical protein
MLACQFPSYLPSFLEYSATSRHQDNKPEPAVPAMQTGSDCFSYSAATIQLSTPVLNSFVFIFSSVTTEY